MLKPGLYIQMIGQLLKSADDEDLSTSCFGSTLKLESDQYSIFGR